MEYNNESARLLALLCERRRDGAKPAEIASIKAALSAADRLAAHREKIEAKAYQAKALERGNANQERLRNAD
tara:strand:- start:11975 stop:12190 length:216 start_codon:yes stop_codon:yes gene_type:complete